MYCTCSYVDDVSRKTQINSLSIISETRRPVAAFDILCRGQHRAVNDVVAAGGGGGMMSMTGDSRMRQRGTTGDDDHRGSNGDESTMRRRDNFQQGRRPRLGASSQQQQNHRRRDVVEDENDDLDGSHDDDDDDDDGIQDDLGEGNDDNDEGRDGYGGNKGGRGNTSNNNRALRNGAANYNEKADRNVSPLAVGDNDQVAPNPRNNYTNNNSVLGHANYANNYNGGSNGNNNNGVLSTNNQANSYGGHANYGYNHYSNNAAGDAVEMALNQKNQRLAKELSDLRVRHREETRVVSRLTMENMNLASRCREAIAQVAALRKELLVHQKRQGEYSNLVKEVERLRRQVGIDTGGVPRGGDFSNSGGTHNIAINAGRDPTSTLPSNVVNDDQQEQTRSPMLSSSTKVSPDGKISHATNNSSNRSDSPATDLDRIMSRQFRKTDRRPLQSNGPAPASSSSASTAKPVATTTTKGGALMNSSSSSSAAPSALKQTRSIAKGNNLMLASSNEKIPISVNATKKMTTPLTSSASSANAPAAVGPSSSEQQQKDDQFDADIDMVDFFAKSQSLLLNDNFGNSVGAHPSSDRSSSHPLPSGVRNHYVRRPRSGSTDDRMPDDVITIASPSLGGSVGAAAGGTVKNPKKASSTSVGLAGGDNNLLSSIDAFEASFAFASAFPETSFSITCDIAPLSSASLAFDVPDFDAFDVPDFDPFFKSLANTTTTTTNSNNNSNNNSLGNRQEAPSLGAEAGARGGTARSGGAWDGDHGMGKNDNSGAATIKSQMIQDLFPESAMNFKSIPKLESLAFDSNPMMGFEPMERTRVSMTPTTTQHHHHLTATTLVAPERLDDLSKPRINARDGGNASPVAVIPSDPSRDDIRAKILHLEAEKHRLSQIASSQAKLRIGGGAIGNNGPLPHIHRSRLASPISPQSMSAEIEQLDAIADLASRTMRGSGVDVGSATSAASAVVANTNPHIHQTTVRSSVRKMKQPVSYAEPSTKSKLRRGDVLFPKVDSSEKIGGKAGEGAGRITPSTELELVMAQIAAASSQLSADVQD